MNRDGSKEQQAAILAGKHGGMIRWAAHQRWCYERRQESSPNSHEGRTS